MSGNESIAHSAGTAVLAGPSSAIGAIEHLLKDLG